MISLDEELAIHAVIVNETGGSHGVRDTGGLQAALNRPYATFDGIDLYPLPVDKAAALLESVVKDHPFVDGNKRAGYVLARLTLNTFDLDLRAKDDEEYDQVIQIATGQLDVDGIRMWLVARVVKL